MLSQGGHLKTRLGISNFICKCGLVCSKNCHPARHKNECLGNKVFQCVVRVFCRWNLLMLISVFTNIPVSLTEVNVVSLDILFCYYLCQ